jgi:hypothetical protein
MWLVMWASVGRITAVMPLALEHPVTDCLDGRGLELSEAQSTFGF